MTEKIITTDWVICHDTKDSEVFINLNNANYVSKEGKGSKIHFLTQNGEDENALKVKETPDTIISLDTYRRA